MLRKVSFLCRAKSEICSSCLAKNGSSHPSAQEGKSESCHNLISSMRLFFIVEARTAACVQRRDTTPHTRTDTVPSRSRTPYAQYPRRASKFPRRMCTCSGMSYTLYRPYVQLVTTTVRTLISTTSQRCTAMRSRKIPACMMF